MTGKIEDQLLYKTKLLKTLRILHANANVHLAPYYVQSIRKLCDEMRVDIERSKRNRNAR